MYTSNTQFTVKVSKCHQTVRKVRMWLVCNGLYRPFSAWTWSIIVCIPPRSNEKLFYSVYIYRKSIHNSVSNNQEKKAVSDGQYHCYWCILLLPLSRWWMKGGSYFALAVVASGIIWTVWNKIERESNVKNPEMVRILLQLYMYCILYCIINTGHADSTADMPRGLKCSNL